MRKIFLKKNCAAVATVVIVAIAVFFSIKIHSNAPKNIPTNPAVTFTLAQAAEKNIPLEISGFVRGEDRADVSPMASGRILHIFKHEGETVEKGDILATIDASQSNAGVSSAQASVDALQKTLDDSKKYYDQLVTQAKKAPSSSATDETIKSTKRARDLQIQAAQDQLVAAQGALAVAQAGKNNFFLTAPFSGTITAVYFREGENANFSVPLISISTQNSQEIETYVSAQDGRDITVGSVASLQSEDGNSISGLVTTVAPGSDSQSLKTLVRIHINNVSNSIRLGDFLHGEILVPRNQDAISIPRNAIVSRGGDQVIFVLNDNNIATEKQIKTIDEHDGIVDVIEGINANQKIVTEGQQYLINGSKTTPYATN